MAHENVDVPGLDVLVGPDHWMVSHLQIRGRGIGFFVDAGQHMNVGARRSVVGVPLFVIDHEWRGDPFHRRMILVFNRDRTGYKRGDVILEAYSAHEIVEPWPHLETIEFA